MLAEIDMETVINVLENLKVQVPVKSSISATIHIHDVDSRFAYRPYAGIQKLMHCPRREVHWIQYHDVAGSINVPLEANNGERMTRLLQVDGRKESAVNALNWDIRCIVAHIRPPTRGEILLNSVHQILVG
jgi:hypothetical protein